MLTEAARTSRPRLSKSKNKKAVDPSRVLHVLGDHILLDGFKIVIDLEKSRGSYLYDSATGRRLIDLYGFFGSMAVGFNHPCFDSPEVQRNLLRATKVKVANSDVYSEDYAEFVEILARVAGLPPLEKYLFIECAYLPSSILNIRPSHGRSCAEHLCRRIMCLRRRWHAHSWLPD